MNGTVEAATENMLRNPLLSNDQYVLNQMNGHYDNGIEEPANMIYCEMKGFNCMEYGVKDLLNDIFKICRNKIYTKLV